MGALGDAIGAYAQPLIDQTDGSAEQLQKAMSTAMLCWNMAIVPDAMRDDLLAGIRGTLNMPEEEFQAFRRDVIEPMVRRHREMFPGLDPTRRQRPANDGRSR